MQKHVQSHRNDHAHDIIHDKRNLDRQCITDKDMTLVSTPQLSVTNAVYGNNGNNNDVSSSVESFEGSVVYLWRSAGFGGVLEKLMPHRDGWKLLDDEGMMK